METPPPSSDSKPKAIIIGNVNISPMALQEQTQDTPPSIEPTVSRFDRNEHSALTASYEPEPIQRSKPAPLPVSS